MIEITVYLIMMIIGAIVGHQVKSKRGNTPIPFIGTVESICTCAILFLMGTRIGANKEVIDHLGSIGIYALISTILIMGCAIATLSLMRRIVGFDKYGNIKEKTKAQADSVSTTVNTSSDIKNSNKIDPMTIIIIVLVILGLLCGHLFVGKLFPDYETFSELAATMIRVGLCLLLLFVGFDLGYEGTAFQNFKRVGLKVLLIPLATVVGSLLGGIITSLVLPITTKEGLAIAAGLGWYSLAPAIILDAGHVTASAISFLHNVLRELCTLMFVPLVAKWVGFIEASGTPGAPGMDICLPVVERSTNSTIAVYALVSGIITSVLVPILVPIMIN